MSQREKKTVSIAISLFQLLVMNVHSIDITLEQYFRAHYDQAGIFTLRSATDGNNGVRFFIEPQLIQGETLQFQVEGNTVKCVSEKVSV